MNVAYFDLETLHLFDEFPGKQKDKRNYSKLGIAVAGILDEKEYRVYGYAWVDQLIEDLKAYDLIVGHNLFNFDYKVLGSYFEYPEAILGTRQAGIVSRTFDTMQEFSHIVNEVSGEDVGWVGLDDIAQRNFGMGKTHDGKLIPQMWREGKHKIVKEYPLNDLEMTKRFYLAGCAGTTIKYNHTLYNKRTNKRESLGEKEIFIKW